MSVLIDMGTAAASTLGTPSVGSFFLFFNSENSNKLTRRNPSGNDFVLEGLAATNRIIISSASDFEGVIDSTKEYFIDGIIDMTGLSLEIPTGGAYFVGFNFDQSGFTCSDSGYTMFTSGAGGSGNVLIRDLHFEVDGTGSKVFDLTSVSGFEAIEINNVNFNNCTEIGEFQSYRQYFESGTGRFGGSPALTFSGTMNGIFFNDTIARVLDNSWSGALFQEGTSLSITGRFLSNANIDLGANSAFVDFVDTVFTQSSGFQLKEMFLSRGGTLDPTDTNLIPNINSSDLVASWKENQGLMNTFVGGRLDLNIELPTVFSGAGVFTDILGTWAASSLEHFSQPANGQLRNDGTNPREFEVFAFIFVDGGPNDDFSVRFQKFDDSASTTTTVAQAQSRIENNVGGNDTGLIIMDFTVDLDQNDYIFPQIANDSDTTSITVENKSYFIIKKRA